MAEQIRFVAMNTYRFFAVNKSDAVISTSWVQCTDDAEALTLARSLVTEGSGIEVWEVGRRVLKLTCTAA